VTFFICTRVLLDARPASAMNYRCSSPPCRSSKPAAGDVSLISRRMDLITDGQIYLETDLFYQGCPAISVGLSVSRVGSLRRSKRSSRSLGKVKLDLRSSELAALPVRLDLDAGQGATHRGQRFRAVQADAISSAPVELQVAVMWAMQERIR